MSYRKSTLNTRCHLHIIPNLILKSLWFRKLGLNKYKWIAPGKTARRVQLWLVRGYSLNWNPHLLDSKPVPQHRALDIIDRIKI